MDENVLAVLERIKLLDPSVSLKYSDEQLLIYIELAYAYVSTIEDFDETKLVMAVALKTLAMVSLPENSSLSSKKIKDVEITYYQGQGKNKWDSLFDSFLKGDGDSDLALYYVGI